MLSEFGVIPYLIERRLIAEDAVVRDRIRISNNARRNQNFVVSGLSSNDFFLKQGKHDLDVGSVVNEAEIYKTLSSSPECRKLRRHIPRFFDYSGSEGILALESIPNALDLQEYHTKSRRFPLSIARNIGKILGILHHSTQDWANNYSEKSRLNTVLPTVFNLRRPATDILKGASGVCIELIKLLQQHEQYGYEFDKLAEQWKIESLIHGDIKLSNFVTYKKHSGARVSGVKLVDWEFSGFGDPRWDIGSIFSSYLSLWIFSVPIANHEHPDQLLHLSRFPLSKIQPGIAAFWHSYREVMQLNNADASLWLIQSIRFSAACLIQTAYEYAKGSNFLTSEIILLMQVSLNIFEQPEIAASQLLGLESEIQLGS